MKKEKPEVVTDYLDGYQYVDGKLEFYPHSEGYVNMKSGTPEYVYNYTDHLGNVRVSYVKGTNGEAEIVEESNYYPFGLKHKGYNNNANTLTDKYKYGYNGKESTEELGYNMLEMDMRQFDPAIARWVVQDPVVHHSMSPYTGFDNNPVFWADPSGADSERRDFFTDEPAAIASTVVNDRGQIIDYKDDGDNNIYLNKRSAENVIGTEREGRKYKEGDYLAIDDLNPNAELPNKFMVRLSDVPNHVIGGTGVLELVGPGGIFKLKTLLNYLKYFSFKRGIKWVFGSFKSNEKWINQMIKRGWTKKQITEAISKGEKIKAVNNVNKGNSATRYVHPKTGKSVVVDDVTNEVLHVGGSGFKY